MDMHLIRHPTDRGPVRFFLDGALVAELSIGQLATAPDLAREVEKARCLQALALFIRHWQRDLEKVKTLPDHVEKTPQARQAAFCRGLEAGLCGQTVSHPGVEAAFMPGLPPESSLAYERGYAHGDAMRRATALALGPEEPA